ncbi:MAG: hypothetical protein ABSG67_07900 [Thermoguttaceae bacterium]
MMAFNKSTALIVRPRSLWRRHLLLSMVAFGLTAEVVFFISQNAWQKSNAAKSSKAVAIMEYKPVDDRANFSNYPIFSPSSNLNNIKTRILSPSFIRQALNDSGIDTAPPAKDNSPTASFIYEEQMLRGLSIRTRPGTISGENQIILELTLTQSPNAAEIARALADRFVREYRTFWAVETQKACVAASSQAEQAEQAHYEAAEMLRAFEDNVIKQEKSTPQQPSLTPADQQSASKIPDNLAWIELDLKLASLRQREAAMLVNKTSLHPDVLDIRARIADYERQIDSTPRFAPDSAINNPLRQLDSPDTVKTPLLKIENEIQENNTRENLAQGADQNQTAETLKQLQLAAERTEQEYLNKLRIKQSIFDARGQEPTFLVRVNPVPVKNKQFAPNRGFVGLMLCSGFAMALGIGVFSSGVSTQSLLASIADLEPLLPAPIIGVVPAKDQSSDPFARRRRRAILRWTLILLGGLLVLGCSIGVHCYFA